MSRRLQTSLLFSMVLHLGFFTVAGTWTGRSLVDGGGLPSAGTLMMVEWVDSPVPAPAPPAVSPEERSPVPEETSPVKEAATSEAPTPEPGSPDGDRGGTAAPGTRLNVDFARMAWIREVFARTLKYQRNAPKGFEGMVRSALSLHPSTPDGSARVTMTFDPSGTVSGVEIRSDVPELKTALRRVGWEAGPLPSGYRIPCSGLNVNVTVAGPNLSVGVEIL